MTKKPQNKPISQKPKDETYKITYKTPAWMRDFLDDKGIEADCSLSKGLPQNKMLKVFMCVCV